MVANKNIQILGLEDFDEAEKDKIISLSNNYYDKISRELPGKLVLHGKKHHSEGGRCRYSFHARIQIPNNLINVNGEDWDLAKALHISLSKVENYAKNKFRTEGK